MFRLSTMAILMLCLAGAAWSQAVPNSALTKEAVARWQGQRFGMFIHWGPASLTGNEISWSRGGTTSGMIPTEEYDRLYTRFNPVQFDAEAWVKTARDAGMRYLVITAKHADGFCLWPTQYLDYNITNTPFKRDVLKELSQACRKYEVQFGTYYCITDWYHPDYPLGSPGGRSKKPNPNLPRYVDYVKNQTRELIENYGPLDVMWFDWGDWVPEYREKAYGDALYQHVKTLQPSLVVNDRVYQPKPPSGDYSTSSTEGLIGGFDRARPWETCMVIGGHWAWDPHAKTYYMSLKECVQMLLRVVGNDGNFLLNVGPNADGIIEPEHVTRLREMGAWLQRYGHGVYATRGGPFKAGRWGASTCKGNTIYLYVMQWPDGGPLVLPAIPAKIIDAHTLSGEAADIAQRADGITVTMLAAFRDPIATVIELTLDSDAFAVPPVTVVSFLQAAAHSPRTPAIARSLPEGRLGLWHLDEGEGASVHDSTKNGHHGTILNTPNWTDGKFGKALWCKSYNALELAKEPRVSLSRAMSVATWVKASAPWFSVFQIPGVCALNIGECGNIGFQLTDNAGISHGATFFASLAFTFDAWHHLAATYDGTTMRLYIDGEEQKGAVNAQFTIKETDAPCRFGWNGTQNPALLDEIMLYDRALAPEEVVALATAKTAEE